MDGPCCSGYSVRAHPLIIEQVAEVVLVRKNEHHVEDRGYILLLVDGLCCPGCSVHAHRLIVLVAEVALVWKEEDRDEDHEYVLLWMDGLCPGRSVHVLVENLALALEDEVHAGDYN
jgi:hypothetical protein